MACKQNNHHHFFVALEKVCTFATIFKMYRISYHYNKRQV